MKVDCNHPQHQTKDGDIMLTYIGMQCMGKPSFDGVHEMDDGTEKRAAIRMGYEITERTMDKNGQFHSELKTDMDLGRLPSGKFQTNELVLELAILSYNTLRMTGQESLGKRNPRLKRTVKRRRHRTVINNLANMACHITEHARKLVIGLGKSNVWREVFQHVYYAFEDFVL